MIRFLENVRSGIIEPRALITAESTKRSYNLGLSPHREIERVHSAAVNTLDIDNGEQRYLISGSADGSIYIHDLHNISGSPNFTARVVCTVEKGTEHAHQYGVECVQWYPFDSGLFATSGMDKQVKIWDTNTLRPVDEFTFDSRVYQHDISKNCLVAVASTSRKVKLVDLKSGSCMHELRGHSGSVLSCKWSSQQEFLLATGGFDNRVLLWDIRSANSCLLSLDQHNNSSHGTQATAHDGIVNGISFTADGLFILTTGTDNKLKLWNSLTGQKEMVNYGRVANNLQRCKQISVTVDANPALAYIPSEGKISVFEVHTGAKVDDLVGHYNFVCSCVYHRHYHELYSGGKDMMVLIWTADQSREAIDDNWEERSTSEPKTQRKHLTVTRNLTRDAWSSDED